MNISLSEGESQVGGGSFVPGAYPNPKKICRARINADWYACGATTGIILGWNLNDLSFSGYTLTSSGGSIPEITKDLGTICVEFEQIDLFDPLGTINNDLLAIEKDGEFYLPSGMELYCYQPADAVDGHYEPLRVGTGCHAGSGSGSGSGSESGESGESGSGSGCYITSDVCWIGSTSCRTVIHLQPMSKTVPADCCKIHLIYPYMRLPCGPSIDGMGLYVDDGGHVAGCDSEASAWKNPYSEGTVTVTETAPGDGQWKVVTITGGTFPTPVPAGTTVYMMLNGEAENPGIGIPRYGVWGSAGAVVTLGQSVGGSLVDVPFVYYTGGKNSPWNIDLTNLNPC
jgi:hypothetical protein